MGLKNVDQPCCQPHIARPPMEAVGLNVMAINEAAGLSAGFIIACMMRGVLQMPVYNPAMVSINVSEVRRYAGLPPKAAFSQQMIHEVCMEAQCFIKPQASWNVFNYHCCSHTVVAIRPWVLTGLSIIRHLGAAQKVALLAVTVGEELTAQIGAYFQQGQSAKALLLDAAGTAAVEAAADQACLLIKQTASKEGLISLPRFSPGYGDWDIAAQPLLLEYSGGLNMGITINQAHMLLPRKTVTAAVGLIEYKPDAEEPIPVKTCAACLQKECLARRSETE